VLTGTGDPRGDPPEPQLEALGPQTEKETVPPGAGPALLPVTVAESLTGAPPSVIELVEGPELVLLAVLPTVRHSPLEPSLEAL
jgi:hypothetical protein